MAMFVHFVADDLNPEVLLDVEGSTIYKDESDGRPIIAFEKQEGDRIVRRYDDADIRDARFKKILVELASITL